MAKVVMSMTEVLQRINMYRKRIEGYPSLGYNRNATNFCAVGNESTGLLTNGTKISDAEDQALTNYDSVMDIVCNLYKLTMAKEAVNTTMKIKIPNPDLRSDGEIEVSVAEALIMKNDTIIKYYETLLKAMTADKVACDKIIEKNMNSSLSDDCVREYVLQRFRDLGVVNPDPKSAKYTELANEYIKAHTLSLIDPIGVADKIEDLEKRLEELQVTVNFRLSEINSKTKIWIDFDVEKNFWGYALEEEEVVE